MKIIETSIPGVLIIEPKYFGDPRGFFMETFEVNRYAAAGIAHPFVQDNLSRSSRGVLRGLQLSAYALDFPKDAQQVAAQYLSDVVCGVASVQQGLRDFRQVGG